MKGDVILRWIFVSVGVLLAAIPIARSPMKIMSQGVGERFDGKRRELIRESTAVEADYRDADRKLLDVESPEGRTQFLSAIARLRAFVLAAPAKCSPVNFI